ncbi:uncharacterized protein Ecym_4495 [Eremothecium cymbalariae DBVPG|uniref:Uncharacterized protein n=1 Tax=Eremothecium cymbalariae (strain CBS 270.75 / DBVPG 7215 / KCTC 17166 / NRRL Y-17582) TaxID=931890 RepID=G8JU31_ERECY|nr:hypothetical protein Ecym_4495 [Eremothecium cymbalariae DBVPG\
MLFYIQDGFMHTKKNQGLEEVVTGDGKLRLADDGRGFLKLWESSGSGRPTFETESEQRYVWKKIMQKWKGGEPEWELVSKRSIGREFWLDRQKEACGWSAGGGKGTEYSKDGLGLRKTLPQVHDAHCTLVIHIQGIAYFYIEYSASVIKKQRISVKEC